MKPQWCVRCFGQEVSPNFAAPKMRRWGQGSTAQSRAILKIAGAEWIELKDKANRENKTFLGVDSKIVPWRSKLWSPCSLSEDDCCCNMNDKTPVRRPGPSISPRPHSAGPTQPDERVKEVCRCLQVSATTPCSMCIAEQTYSSSKVVFTSEYFSVEISCWCICFICVCVFLVTCTRQTIEDRVEKRSGEVR